MSSVDIPRLLRRLNPYCRDMLSRSVNECRARGNPEVLIEHMLWALLDEVSHDFQTLLRHYRVSADDTRTALQRQLEAQSSGSQAERPLFSQSLVDWLEYAWLRCSVDFGASQIRSGALLLALKQNQRLSTGTAIPSLFDDVPLQDFADNFEAILALSVESAVPRSEPTAETGTVAGPDGDGSLLGQFTTDFTQRARDGLIDPVFCRDREIRQIIDILGRRRKNNPLAVGEAGVGKTAVVEGLALRIVEEDVPDTLRDVTLLGLDLQALQAGASVRGEFEKRLKGVMEAVKASPTPIVLFIDEVHMLMGAGGQAGTGDAANILKPALARGEFRTVAATTWSEYKQHMEKDAALARRFQLVALDEPSVEQAVTILRGLRPIYEAAHDVYVRDDALIAAAELSARYVTGRQLPDKAIDVLDTACARVKLSLFATPPQLEDTQQRLKTLQRERDARARDIASAVEQDAGVLETLDSAIEELAEKTAALKTQWSEQQTIARQLVSARRALQAQADDVDPEAAGEDALSAEALQAKIETLAELSKDESLVQFETSPAMVAEVISDWTGIPVGRMVSDDARAVLTFKDDLGRRIKGQAEAVEALDQGLRAARAGLRNPDAPLGVYLLVGPSGVGKTETAHAIADFLFGGDRFMTTINMSEFMEKHTVSRLIGSPPGYVGYGEGGMLTEAVRQRPYSVVLFDEIEKAHPDVMNLFYQVFDKGELADGESRLVDFRNTFILMTSNLATDLITEHGQRADRNLPALLEQVRPVLAQHFKPALLARMQIVPYWPLLSDDLVGVVELKLQRLVDRVREAQNIAMTYDAEVVRLIVDRCTEVGSGARNADFIINQSILPPVSTAVLEHISREEDLNAVHISKDAHGEFAFTYR